MIDIEELKKRLCSMGVCNAPAAAHKAMTEAADALTALQAENERLQRIIDSRPAINAGLPGTYIEWSQSIYAMDMTMGETKQ